MPFEAMRLVKTYEMTAPAGCEDVFPLLCPVREYDWIPHWECNMIYSPSGKAELGCVFETDFPDRGEMTWVATKYEPPRLIQYTVFKADSHVWNLEIELFSEKTCLTRLLWRHTFTATSMEGNRYLSEYTDEKHRLQLSMIEKALIYYLETGKMIDAHKLHP